MKLTAASKIFGARASRVLTPPRSHARARLSAASAAHAVCCVQKCVDVAIKQAELDYAIAAKVPSCVCLCERV
jgi:hypothetical protein